MVVWNIVQEFGKIIQLFLLKTFEHLGKYSKKKIAQNFNDFRMILSEILNDLMLSR